MGRLERSTAVVTGGSTGIGWETALALARAGANVSIISRAGGVVDDLQPDHLMVVDSQIHAWKGDVSRLEEMEGFADAVASEFGGIDIWINNAAVLFVRPFMQMLPADWDRVLATNLNGYYYGCRAAARYMGAGGSIVNVSSVVDVQPISSMAAYVTAKGGIVALTKVLALELGHRGIRVNAVAPGAVDTPLNAEAYTSDVRRVYADRIPLGRIAQPSDIADAILFLCSDASRYITGHELLVDGGLVLNGNVGHQEGPTQTGSL